MKLNNLGLREAAPSLWSIIQPVLNINYKAEEVLKVNCDKRKPEILINYSSQTILDVSLSLSLCVMACL